MTATRTPARVGIIGTGWRAAMFADVAAAIPDRVEIQAALSRSGEAAQTFAARHRIHAVTDAERFLAHGKFDFVIVCVSAHATPTWVRDLAWRGIPTLVETPIAPDRDSLTDLLRDIPVDAPVQLAEQYRYQPQHAARLAVVHSGLIGPPHAAFSSVAHYYHGVSLLRAALGIGFERVTISADRFTDRVLSTLGRRGWDASPTIRSTERISARLAFPDRGALALYDFDEEQYFSPIRTRHFSVSGERGEIADDNVTFARGIDDVVRLRLHREETGIDGDLEGRFLRRITLGERVVYDNPFAPARLSDDEVAIATVLTKMSAFTQNRRSFYGLADAAEDQYLSLLIADAARGGETVHSGRRAWQSAPSALARTFETRR